MSLLLIHKYQPQYLRDFDQEPQFIQLLQTFLQLDNLNLLLIGDSETSKTTLIQALIREYYHSYSFEQYQENLFECNVLKEQGANYYRNDIKIFCQNSSQIRGKKKIVILDDLDMINEQHQQIFRHLIDQYSNNAHFLASCANPQKVLEPLQSRLFIMKIRPLDKSCLSTLLQKIAVAENIAIETDAQNFLVELCNHRVKPLLNYLEKCKLLGQQITLDIAQTICTTIHFSLLEEYMATLRNGDLKGAVAIIFTIYEKGFSIIDIFSTIFTFVKITKCLSEKEKYDILPFICKYIAIFYNLHEDQIELALFTNNIYKKINNILE